MRATGWMLLFFAAAGAIAQDRTFEAGQAQAKAQEKLSGESSPPIAFDDEDCKLNLVLCGQVFGSELTTRDCKLSTGGYADFYAFPIAHAQAFGAAVSSPSFAPFLAAFDPNNNVVALDTATPGAIASLGYFANRLGVYTLAVASQNTIPTQTGNYTLALVCDSSKCKTDPYTLCLGNGRFRVQAAWENQYNGKLGFGVAVPRTQAAGFFTFGDPTNVELLVKVLDFGDSVKVFYGQLTDLKFQVTVTDMVASKSETYRNTAGDCGGLDQRAFEALAGASTGASAACTTGKSQLCLLRKRFAISVNWRNQYNGTSGSGSAVSLSDLTGAFYFTDAGNLELMVKMLDFGDRIAVFYGTLSDLEYNLTVQDTVTGKVKTYTNPAGKFCGGLDNNTF